MYAEHMPSGNLQFGQPEYAQPQQNTKTNNMYSEKEPHPYSPCLSSSNAPKLIHISPGNPPELISTGPTLNKRRCGLSKRVFYLVMAVVLLIVAGGIIGGAVAALKGKNDPPDPSSTPGQVQPGNGTDTASESSRSSFSTSVTTSNTRTESRPLSTSTAASSTSLPSSSKQSPTSVVSSVTSASEPTSTPTSQSVAAFDSNIWYRISNSNPNYDSSLDVLNDAGTSSSGTLSLTDPGDVSGQYWQVRHSTTSNTYTLCTSFLGPNMRLDVAGLNPVLAPASSSASGQQWTIVEGANGTFRLSSVVSGGDLLFLDTEGDTRNLIMSTGEHSGQYWYITSRGKSINDPNFA
ncbi:hypothetical protein VTL71DRAFT_16150 [Oculimacula yallundae]|uniref:Ricin B lectin domain-containing protein n=1 Tax=Oculimacula yallundae TaxID=86028 RepID=A0ABR4CEC7_9HELO